MKTAFVVLGMHRSGTSAVAGSLARMGATPPDSLMPAKADNPLGFWESERLVAFNEEILTVAGSCWYDWGPLDATVFQGSHSAHLNTAGPWLIGHEFRGADTIVVKDPRICRCYPYWRRTLHKAGYRALPILPIRRPSEVARSLARRNGLSSGLAQRLWLRHVLDAEKATRGQPRFISTLDAFIADWPDRFARLSATLGVDLNASDSEASRAVDVFWSRESLEVSSENSKTQVHHRLVLDVWDSFQCLSANAEDADALKALDRARRHVAALLAFFYDRPAPLPYLQS